MVNKRLSCSLKKIFLTGQRGIQGSKSSGKQTCLRDRREAKRQVERPKRNHSQQNPGQQPPKQLAGHLPRSLAVKGRQRLAGAWGAGGRCRGEQWARADCVELLSRIGRSIPCGACRKKNRARFWMKLLRRVPEYGSGKRQGQGRPQDLWLREQRWGAWCPDYSYLGEDWSQLVTSCNRHPCCSNCISH